MHWDDARMFLAFAREGSFSAAAKRLDVQHSTVSRRIHALEKKLATPLVERSPSGYILTPAGEKLRESAVKIEREILSFEAASAGQSDEPAGPLRVTAIQNMASTLLMPMFARFSVAYPNIDLRIDVTNDSVRLAERDADVALRQTNSPGETLIGTRLVTVASAVYGSHEYCVSIRTEQNAEKWIGVDCCDYHRNWTRKACLNGDHSFVVDDTSLTAAAIKEGMGVGFLPCFIGDSDPNLERLREPEEEHNLGLWFLYHRDLRRTKRVILFREHMQREMNAIRHLFEGTGLPNLTGPTYLREPAVGL